MSEPRCERTDLLVSACAHCRGHDEPSPNVVRDLEAPSAWTAAQYPGRCQGCDGQIRDGDRIALCGGVWVCGECGESA